MGYCSDIKIKIETINGLDTHSLADNLKNRLGDEAYLIDTVIRCYTRSEELSITLSSFKIGHHLEAMDIIEDWFHELAVRADTWCDGCGTDDEPTICGAQFIRIGEDLDDNEDLYYGELSKPMCIARYIEE